MATAIEKWAMESPGITLTLTIQPEYCGPEDSFDDRDAADVRRQIEAGNEWAWCWIKVVASYGPFSGSDSLGGCSYKDEADFRKGGYYEDMCNEARRDLARQIEAHAAVIRDIAEEARAVYWDGPRGPKEEDNAR